MNLIGISGKMGSGKNTLAIQLKTDFLRRGVFLKIVSLSDILRRELGKVLIDLEDQDSMTKKELDSVRKKHKINPEQFNQLLELISQAKAEGDGYIEAWHRGDAMRKVLQFYGTGIRRTQDEDYWVKKGIEKAQMVVDKNGKDTYVVFAEVRFLNEAKAIKDVGGKLIRIECDVEERIRRVEVRDGIDISNQSSQNRRHASEVELDDFDGFDYIINSTFADFGGVADIVLMG